MNDPRIPGDTPAEQQPPAPQPPAADAPTVAQPAAPPAAQPAAVAADQPAPPAEGPGVGSPAAPPASTGGFRRLARHRATQLVAAGLVGALLGGGIVATAEAVSHRSDGSRSAIARQLDGGQFGPGQGRRGFRGPAGTPGSQGPNNGPNT